MKIEGLIDNSANKLLQQSLTTVLARWREAKKLSKSEGLTVTLPNGCRMIHPAVRIAQACEKELRMIVREMQFERPDGDEALLKHLQEVLKNG